MIALALLCWPRPVLAGPPLIADDPNTIGPGNVLPIISASVLAQGGETAIQAPISDLTVGLVNSLDFTLLTPLVSRRNAEVTPPWSHTTLFAPGLKWEFFETDRGSLCFSPAFYINSGRIDRSFALLPMEGELKVGRRRKGTIGFDIGYQPVLDATHRWFVAPYARYMVRPELSLLLEVWSLGSNAAVRTGGSVGVNTGPATGHIRALAAVGTGFVSFGAARVDVRAYLGVQYMFSPR